MSINHWLCLVLYINLICDIRYTSLKYVIAFDCNLKLYFVSIIIILILIAKANLMMNTSFTCLLDDVNLFMCILDHASSILRTCLFSYQSLGALRICKRGEVWSAKSRKSGWSFLCKSIFCFYVMLFAFSWFNDCIYLLI